ncbi:hypothetical protein Mal15_08010 [Stieleria maiorica]|uniref:VWFA domain-containing protein n=1 Tax=Stieleria maiorica TaxID=2795974 RepID=A0A5B9M6H7_9BACT|nr:hypothetical protein [Stieleria maiorica]QEF96771.1 hypothetical protein Mal15_08010 [Stieleria maiorica]
MSESPNDSRSGLLTDPVPRRPAPQGGKRPSDPNRLRELQLELDRIRSRAEAARLAASAARLDADAARLDTQAAELELQIQRLGGIIHPKGHPADSLHQIAQRANRIEAADPPRYQLDSPRARRPKAAEVIGRIAATEVPPHTRPESDTSDLSDASETATKIDRTSPRSNPRTTTLFGGWNQVREVLDRPSKQKPPKPEHHQDTKDRNHRTDAVAPDRVELALHLAADLATESPDPTPQRRRPAAWLLSALFHGFLLLGLALLTLASPPPRDQIAIAGSVAETDELAIESLTIETPTLQPPSSEPTPSEVPSEISDLGEIPISEILREAPPTPPSPMIDSMLSGDPSSAAAMSLKSDSDATMDFCGVDGGGNHFVYLVDSSGSMGNAFESARAELLRSINLLKPEQRFYVIFFDAQPDYMRLSSLDQDEPRSVYATPENKHRLQRWAKTIRMDRGRAPYDALPFALELNPDVIFLLSDGEFPQRIEDLLQDINRVDNLFGDDDPISIVHTIGYHSRDGESRMRRIAAQNGGQYRHVPKPRKN